MLACCEVALSRTQPAEPQVRAEIDRRELEKEFVTGKGGAGSRWGVMSEEERKAADDKVGWGQGKFSVCNGEGLGWGDCGAPVESSWCSAAPSSRAVQAFRQCADCSAAHASPLRRGRARRTRRTAATTCACCAAAAATCCAATPAPPPTTCGVWARATAPWAPRSGSVQSAAWADAVSGSSRRWGGGLALNQDGLLQMPLSGLLLQSAAASCIGPPSCVSCECCCPTTPLCSPSQLGPPSQARPLGCASRWRPATAGSSRCTSCTALCAAPRRLLSRAAASTRRSWKMGPVSCREGLVGTHSRRWHA